MLLAKLRLCVAVHVAPGGEEGGCLSIIANYHTLRIYIYMYIDCGVSEYDREAYIMRRPWPNKGHATGKRRHEILCDSKRWTQFRKSVFQN